MGYLVGYRPVSLVANTDDNATATDLEGSLFFRVEATADGIEIKTVDGPDDGFLNDLEEEEEEEDDDDDEVEVEEEEDEDGEETGEWISVDEVENQAGWLMYVSACK